MGSKKILLVEDDPNFGTVLKDYLALNDYNVTHAKDGIEGLIMFKNNDFDLCILDVMMPRKDGFSLAKDIRSKNKEIPIIFLTAKTLKEDVLRGYQVGADDYLNKPFDSEEPSVLSTGLYTNSPLSLYISLSKSLRLASSQVPPTTVVPKA